MGYLALPSGRSGRVLAVTLGFALVAGFSAGVVRPLLHAYADRTESFTARAAELQRLEALAGQLPAWRERARIVAGSLPDDLFLAGDTDPVAAASAEATLLSMLTDLGAASISAEEIGTIELGAHRQLRFQVSFTSSWPGLVELLDRLGRSKPLLLVDELEIRPARHRVGYRAGTLDVKCTMVAFRAWAQRRAAS